MDYFNRRWVSLALLDDGLLIVHKLHRPWPSEAVDGFVHEVSRLGGNLLGEDEKRELWLQTHWMRLGISRGPSVDQRLLSHVLLVKKMESEAEILTRR